MHADKIESLSEGKNRRDRQSDKIKEGTSKRVETEKNQGY